MYNIEVESQFFSHVKHFQNHICKCFLACQDQNWHKFKWWDFAKRKRNTILVSNMGRQLFQEQYRRLFVRKPIFCSLSDMRDGIQYFTNREVCRKEKCDDLTCRVLKLLYSYESRFLPLVAKVCYQRVGSSIMQNCRISSLRNCKNIK